MVRKSARLLLLAIQLLCACGGEDDAVEPLPACRLIASPDALASSSSVHVYPDDRFGLTAQTSVDSIYVSGVAERYSSLDVLFEPCVDVAEYSGLSFRLSGSQLPPKNLYFSLLTRENEPAPYGSCQPRSAETYTDCATAGIVLTSEPGLKHFRWPDLSGGKPNFAGDRRQVNGFAFGLGNPTQASTVSFTVDQLALF